MISIASDCLLFQLTSGESIPLSSEMISVEFIEGVPGHFQPELFKHATAAVFHYFKHDLNRHMVTAAEFVGALEKALRGFGFSVRAPDEWPATAEKVEGDLRLLASDSAEACELVFYPRLRLALREQLRRSPEMVRFHSLRGCVKRLAGARRWCPRCDNLRDQIVGYLRGCLGAETHDGRCSLVVE